MIVPLVSSNPPRLSLSPSKIPPFRTSIFSMSSVAAVPRLRMVTADRVTSSELLRVM